MRFGRVHPDPSPAVRRRSPGTSPRRARRDPRRGDAGRADDLRLSIDGPVKLTHHLLPAAGIDVAAIDAALRVGDADALYSIDREFAPFLCRQCAKSYCKTCWTVWIDFDDGFYDCTRGRCPEGHIRLMDD